MTKLICICFLNIVCLRQNVLAVDIQREKWGGVETNGIQMAIQLDESTQANLTNKDVVILFRLNNVTTNETFEIYQSHGFDSDGCSFEIAFPSGDKSILPAKYYAGSGAF